MIHLSQLLFICKCINDVHFSTTWYSNSLELKDTIKELNFMLTVDIFIISVYYLRCNESPPLEDSVIKVKLSSESACFRQWGARCHIRNREWNNPEWVKLKAMPHLVFSKIHERQEKVMKRNSFTYILQDYVAPSTNGYKHELSRFHQRITKQSTGQQTFSSSFLFSPFCHLLHMFPKKWLIYKLF